MSSRDKGTIQRESAKAARRKATIQAAGVAAWRPRSARFRDRKKEAARRACRGRGRAEQD